MKRFYKEAVYCDDAGAYLIKLDDRTINTPANNVLISHSEALAKEICAEWNAQDENVVPDSMPITQYCYTALDYIPKHKAEIITTVLNFLDTDLVCYRTDDPADLVAKQSEAWDLFIDWFEGKFNHKLETTTGLAALSHPQNVHDNVAVHVNGLDNEHLTILQSLTAACGSLVMALCFVDGQASVEQMFNAAFVEELHQGSIYDEDRYGVDPTQEKQRAKLKSDLEAARRYLDSLAAI